MIRFQVWANAQPMGWFGHAAGEFFFEYDTQWLAQPGAYVLAPQFPLAALPARGALVRSFFDNLLPEGEVMEDVLAALQLRGASPLEVLGRLGKELPGVLSLLPEGEMPLVEQNYRALPLAELSARLAGRVATPLETFDAVGAHSWEAFCTDCGFGFLPTLAEFRRMVLALLPAWRQVQAGIAKEKGVTEAELAMLARMSAIFGQHVDHALSMTTPSAGALNSIP